MAALAAIRARNNRFKSFYEHLTGQGKEPKVAINAVMPIEQDDVSVISAPVYDHHQRQVMVVSLHIGRALTDAEITARARALVATADRVTAQLAGNKPSP